MARQTQKSHGCLVLGNVERLQAILTTNDLTNQYLSPLMRCRDLLKEYKLGTHKFILRASPALLKFSTVLRTVQ